MGNKLKQIAEGYKNLVKKGLGVSNDDVETLAADRYRICNTCEDRQGLNCGVCGCVLGAKIRSLESGCPKELW